MQISKRRTLLKGMGAGGLLAIGGTAPSGAIKMCERECCEDCGDICEEDVCRCQRYCY